MLIKIRALLLVAGICLVSYVVAQTVDDRKRTRQCIDDNRDAKIGLSTVFAYCTCMHIKMGDKDTQSIAHWEKSHPAVRRTCERQAGWT